MTADRWARSGASARGESAQWGDAFVRLLATQLDLLGRLDALSRRQRSLFDAADGTALKALLDERQTIVLRLEELHAQAMPFHERLSADTQEPAGAARADLERGIVAVSDLARSILQRDQSDQDQLAQRRREISNELAELASGKKASAAYRRPGSGGPTFQDREV